MNVINFFRKYLRKDKNRIIAKINTILFIHFLIARLLDDGYGERRTSKNGPVERKLKMAI